MFESARLKLERAYQHGLELEQTFGSFAYNNPHEARIKFNVDGGQIKRVWVEVLAPKPLPDSLSLSLGDAIHNLRCAVDHVTWELMGIDGGTQNKFTKFPVGDTRQRYESACRAMPTPRDDTKQFLIDLAAYKGGTGQMLYAINALDNADKHHAITPVLHASQVDGVTFIKLGTGERERRGPLFTKPGQRQATFLIEAPAGEGIDVKEEINPTPDIFLGEVDIVPHEPVIWALNEFDTAVRQMIEGAQRMVRSRA